MRGLALKLFSRVGMTACLVLLVVLAVDLDGQRRTLVNQADLQARHQVEGLGEVVDHYLLAASQLTEDLVAFQAPYGADPAPRAFPFLLTLLSHTPTEDAFGVYLAMEKREPSGAPLIVWVNRNSMPAQAHLEYDFHEDSFLWYQDARKKPNQLNITEPYYDAGASNIAMVSLTRAILDSKGVFVGVAGTDLALDQIRETVVAAQSELGYGNGYFYLVSRSGRVIAHPDERLQVSKTSAGAMLAELPEGKLVQPGAGTGRLTIDDQVRRIYWEQAPLSGWTVVCNLPEEAILAPLVPFIKQGLGLIALSMLLTLAVVALIGLRISLSVSQLTEAADSARRGDYGGLALSAPTRRADELGRLARSFLALFRQLGSREERLRETQRELKAREENFNWLLENSLALLAVLDREGKILSYTSRLIPHAPSQLEDLLVSADREGYRRLWTGQVRGSLEVRLQSEPDKFFELNVQDHSHDPSVNGIVVSLRDVTERKRSQEAELEREAAQAASDAKSAFLATMSHELRTPLNAVVGYSEMLLEDAQDRGETAVVQDLNKILGAARHLLALISDILDLSKVEAGRMELSLEMFDLDPVLDNVVATVQPLVAKNRNQLVVERQASLGRMRGDLTKLRQSLFNLLSNASKFTEQGKVTLRARTEGPEWLSFEVADTGIGMTPEQLSRLFQAFSQADETTSRKYGGTGLGLMLTRNFCRLLGGDVSVLSRAGEGTTFTMRLPRYSTETPREEKPAESTAPVPLDGAARRVLVIDDNPDARELMTRSLEKAGYEVHCAPGGAEGLNLAHQVRPHLITLDILMPRVDGWKVLTSLKQDPILADVPVLLVSIRVDRDLALTLGAAGYLTKPVDRDELLKVVSQLAPSARSALVVDDDPAARELLVRLLEGWRVREAEDGLQALERLKEEKSELILTDLLMPRMDGFELSQRLREDPELATIPVIVVTSKDLSAEELRELEGSDRTVLRKGFQPGELVKLMNSMFSRKDKVD